MGPAASNVNLVICRQKDLNQVCDSSTGLLPNPDETTVLTFSTRGLIILSYLTILSNLPVLHNAELLFILTWLDKMEFFNCKTQ